MIKKFLILIFPIYLFAVVNPYENLAVEEKLNIMINYFLNEELRTKLPLKPVKEILKDDGASLDPVKYEYYFSYIQRIKAIRESRAEEQKAIDEKYAGKVSFYNGKVKVLKKFYNKMDNLNPILQNSLNKAYKVVYGKPKIKDVQYDSSLGFVTATLYIEDIYGINKYKEKKIKIALSKQVKYLFLRDYEKAIVKVQFDYEDDLLVLKNVLFEFRSLDYIGTFLEKQNEKINFVVKIDEDVFKPIKIKDKK
jgi:hypothetical protein